MHDHDIPPVLILALSILVLAAAPLLHRLARWSPLALRSLGFGIAAATGLLVIFDILPECAEEVGTIAFAAAAAGLVLSVVAERRLYGTAHRLAPWVAALALGVHALTDGLAIAGCGHHHHDAMGFAVVMHRLPVGLALWWLLAPRSKVLAVLALCIEGLGTVVGFGLGETIAPLVDAGCVWFFQAFAAGVLLHVVMHVRGVR